MNMKCVYCDTIYDAMVNIYYDGMYTWYCQVDGGDFLHFNTFASMSECFAWLVQVFIEEYVKNHLPEIEYAVAGDISRSVQHLLVYD